MKIIMNDTVVFPIIRGGWNIFTAVLIVLTPSYFASAEIVPASRRMNWEGNVGVPGGIPNRNIIYQTLDPGAGAAQIEAAINSCPPGQVVKLNAGVYNLSAQIRIY